MVNIWMFWSKTDLNKGKEDCIVELDEVTPLFSVLTNSRAGGAPSRSWWWVCLRQWRLCWHQWWVKRFQTFEGMDSILPGEKWLQLCQQEGQSDKHGWWLVAGSDNASWCPWNSSQRPSLTPANGDEEKEKRFEKSKIIWETYLANNVEDAHYNLVQVPVEIFNCRSRSKN